MHSHCAKNFNFKLVFKVQFLDAQKVIFESKIWRACWGSTGGRWFSMLITFSYPFLISGPVQHAELVSPLSLTTIYTGSKISSNWNCTRNNEYEDNDFSRYDTVLLWNTYCNYMVPHIRSTRYHCYLTKSEAY